MRPILFTRRYGCIFVKGLQYESVDIVNFRRPSVPEAVPTKPDVM